MVANITLLKSGNSIFLLAAISRLTHNPERYVSVDIPNQV
jgi:hypothetical protein